MSSPDRGVDLSWQVVRPLIASVLLAVGMLLERGAAPEHWIIHVFFLTSYLSVGLPVLVGAARNIVRGRVFDELFLMSIATLGAVAIGEFSEAVAVMLFYSVGEALQERAVHRSRRSISALMDIRPDTARVVDGEHIRIVPPEDVSVGTTVEVQPGERIPVDAVVLSGISFVNTQALTGESMPRSAEPGVEVLAGFVNETGTLRLRTVRPLAESSVSRILDLVEHAAERKAPTEKFITRFASVYTPVVVAVALAVALVPPLFFGADPGEWVYRSLVVLVVSCPCALVISIPLGYFGGIGGASRRQILVKGAAVLDALKNLDTVVFDKTGTLTEGVFAVRSINPVDGVTAAHLLDVAASAEAQSSHPIARSIREARGHSESFGNDIESYREDRGYGVIATVGGHIAVAGNDRLLHRWGIAHGSDRCGVGGTVVHVALDGAYLGHLVVADTPKPEAADAIRALRRLGVRRILMLTGDDDSAAARVADVLGLDGYSANLLPEDKVAAIEQMDGYVGFVGDGINDAPVIMRADVGFAMGGIGSDAAIEAADIVIMDDSILRISESLRVARFTRNVVHQNIVFALAVKGLFITLGLFGIAGMWEAVFGDMGVALLALLNATRTFRLDHDST